MGVVNKHERLKALNRQKLLVSLHCSECINKDERSHIKWCDGCAIYDEFQKLGKVLDKTVRERAVWDYDKGDAS